MKTSFEIYRSKEIGKVHLSWRGVSEDDQHLAEKISTHLGKVKKLVLVVESAPTAVQTCLREVVHLVRQFDRLGIEAQIVFPDSEIFDAVSITGFDHFFTFWPDEAQAAQALGITQLYPLLLIKTLAEPPMPPAA